MNTPRRLIWQLYPSYLVLVLCAVLAVSWFATDFMRRFYLDHLRTTLAYHGRIMQARIADDLMPLDPQRLDRDCKAAAMAALKRFVCLQRAEEFSV